MPKITITLPDSVLATLRALFPATQPTGNLSANSDAQTLYRALAELLARYGVAFDAPAHGGQRQGAGRKAKPGGKQ